VERKKRHILKMKTKPCLKKKPIGTDSRLIFQKKIIFVGIPNASLGMTTRSSLKTKKRAVILNMTLRLISSTTSKGRIYLRAVARLYLCTLGGWHLPWFPWAKGSLPRRHAWQPEREESGEGERGRGKGKGRWEGRGRRERR
jgi:hypothetical protein